MLSWVGYIKCDMCDERIKLEEKESYNDLNICKACKKKLEVIPKKKKK